MTSYATAILSIAYDNAPVSITDLSGQRAPVRAFQDAEGGEEKASGEVYAVVAGVKFNETRDNDQRRIFFDDDAQKTDNEVADGERETQLLSNDGLRTHGHSEQDQPQDDVRQIMGEGVVMFIVAAGNVEEG
jgi:hypothetical protein